MFEVTEKDLTIESLTVAGSHLVKGIIDQNRFMYEVILARMEPECEAIIDADR
jgi:hypothetical protein